MNAMGSFVPRLLALTVIWLLATAALTFAAAQKIGTAPVVAPTPQAAAPVAAAVLVVPDLRRQAFVFAKGTLSDAGFAFRIQGAVHGFPSNTVVSQSPAPGTRVTDTGAPLVVLHLARTGKELGLPEDVSSVTPTALKLADLAARTIAPAKRSAPAKAAAPAKAPVPAKALAPKRAATPPQRLPQNRPPAFVVPGARREPLDEIPLTVRASALLAWLERHPSATDANVRHWLYQHSWIVAGARMGWWHGEEALQTLLAADRRVWALWGIGARSSAVARQASDEVSARSK
jgi:hypothetical protein